MKNSNDGFIRGRLRSLKFALKGLWLLLTTEDSIKTQFFFGIVSIIIGFYFDISATDGSGRDFCTCNTFIDGMAGSF